MKGRKPKTVEQLQAAGTYRADRHGRRRVATPASGAAAALARPSGLCGEAVTLWDQIAPELSAAGVIQPGDEPLLRMLCEVWALYRAAYREASLAPTDQAARSAVVAYAQAMDRLASRFGLSPSERGRLRAAVPTTPQVASRKPDDLPAPPPKKRR